MTRLTKEQAVVIGAFTGFLAGPFHEMHEYIERILGRPVFTHEMGSEKLHEEIREAARADFMALCAQGE